MNVCSDDILRRKSHGKFTMDKFVKLKELARNTVGVNTDCYRIELGILITLYSQLDSRIDELDKQITAIVTEINPQTLSIKGIGPVSAVIIVSELGDVLRFATPDSERCFPVPLSASFATWKYAPLAVANADLSLQFLG